jgi:hypothetical protein
MGQAAPATLPANFTGWDKEAPDTLPANFSGWDEPRPGVAPPELRRGKGMDFVNPVPTENIPVAGPMLQPFGELYENLKRDPEFRNDTATYGAGSAAVVGGGAGLSMVGPSAVAGAGRVAARHPFLTSMAISEARKIPYVGKFIPPYAEFVPLLSGGKGAKPSAENAEVAPAGRPAEPAEFTLDAKPPTAPSKEFNLLPEAPGRVIEQTPGVDSKADIAETKAIQEQMRNAGDAEDRTRLSQANREWFGNNSLSRTKGELTGQTEKPVTLTKTSGAKVSGKASADDDLLRLLQESLEAAQKARK